MLDWSLAFDPLVPWPLVWAAAMVAALLAALAFWRRARGAPFRLMAFAAALLALANPSAVEEEREPLTDVAIIVTDTSQSQSVGERTADARSAREVLRERLAALPGLELREIDVPTAPESEGGGSNLFAALDAAAAEIPPERFAGAILLTDGQVHDVPAPGALEDHPPVHALLTGRPGERDRKLTVVEAARFGIVGERVRVKLKVEDFGREGAATAAVTVRRNGETVLRRALPTNAEQILDLEIPTGGDNVFEFEAEEGPAELTLANNRAVVTVTGVRDRLRVLLVSGKPHAGERTWRDLLKADPSVDLVHFTILRPPEKNDGTPTRELSLIAFPTRELFVEKLDEFDLIVFDRYQRRSLFPVAYFANIAQYVEDGGALLVASGPEYADRISVYQTPLAAVLPARPTGEVREEGFRPAVSEAGQRHPVTAGLTGAGQNGTEPTWGRWYRLIGTERLSGETLMTGLGSEPLLVLDRFGEGRVAQLNSDQAWLWTRGYDGGGPQGELLRRLAHWLMKEPDLEEEKLRATIAGGQLTIERRTMSETPPEARVTFPSGREETVRLAETAPGRFAGGMEAPELGLYRIVEGDLTAVAAAGALNPRELMDLRATDEILRTPLRETGGAVRWLADGGVPQIRRVAPGRDASGTGWIGLRENGAAVVTGVTVVPLMPPLVALLLIASAIGLAWWRESR